MKLTLRQAILFLVGGTAGALGMQNASSTAHADIVTVKFGDTTWGLSRKYGTTVKKIVKDNHLKNGGKDIYVDQKLNIKNNKKVKTAYADTKTTSTSAQSAVSQAPAASSIQSSQQQSYNYGAHKLLHTVQEQIMVQLIIIHLFLVVNKLLRIGLLQENLVVIIML